MLLRSYDVWMAASSCGGFEMCLPHCACCRRDVQGWGERPVFGKIRYMNYAGELQL
jgi:hypothetical protein